MPEKCLCPKRHQNLLSASCIAQPLTHQANCVESLWNCLKITPDSHTITAPSSASYLKGQLEGIKLAVTLINFFYPETLHFPLNYVANDRIGLSCLVKFVDNSNPTKVKLLFSFLFSSNKCQCVTAFKYISEIVCQMHFFRCANKGTF